MKQRLLAGVVLAIMECDVAYGVTSCPVHVEAGSVQYMLRSAAVFGTPPVTPEIPPLADESWADLRGLDPYLICHYTAGGEVVDVTMTFDLRGARACEQSFDPYRATCR